MSLKFINDFHIKLHKLLSSNERICTLVDKIYITVTNETKYPFILINIINVINKSTNYISMFDVEFEICIFSRNKNQTQIAYLAELINQNITPVNCCFSGYIIPGIRYVSVNMQRSQDLITTKFSMLYKALIKQNDHE